MTKLTEFLSPENVRQGVLISSKKRALELVGKIVAESSTKPNSNLKHSALLNALAIYLNVKS